MTGDKNSRIFSNTDIHSGNFRIAIGTGICSIEHRHASDTIVSSFQCECDQVIGCEGIIQCCSECPLQEGIDFRIIRKQYIGVLGVSGQTF